MLLKGLLSIKGGKKLNDPDIIYSVVDKKKYNSNYLNIRHNDNKTFYIYHSYNFYNNDDEIERQGRWYIMSIHMNNMKFNWNKRQLEIMLKNIDWEDDITGKSMKKDVKIKILFTERGFMKLNKFMDK